MDGDILDSISRDKDVNAETSGHYSWHLFFSSTTFVPLGIIKKKECNDKRKTKGKKRRKKKKENAVKIRI